MIERIFHISDIHIKVENYTNLQNSFVRLVNDIVKSGVETSLLVIAGDVFENKTFLTGEELYIFFWMLEGLKAKKITTIIIPGNHDYNINSFDIKNNIEVLTRHFPNIHCLSATQIYPIDNVEFYVFSPIDKKIPDGMSRNTKAIKIALLHEPINNAKFDTGESIINARFKVSNFDTYDLVMLGDIHKPQFLTDRIAYSGSFVQKNKGEGLDHGYILWDLKTLKGKHCFIPLKEVFLKIEAHNNKCHLPVLTADQKIRYISLFHGNCSETFIAKIKQDIADKYGIINKIVNKDIFVLKDTEPSQDIKLDSNEKVNPVDQSELIREILSDKSPELIQNIINYHNTKLQNRTETNYARYKLLYLVWNNVYCYGEGNFIDFRNFKHNIVLLNGRNKQGKSSVIDILLRVLFNEAERGYKEDIVNKHCKQGTIKLSFEIANDIYIIQQSFTEGGKSNSHRLFKNDVNITKHSIMETYKYIKYDLGIGDYKDFINLTTALQNRKFLIDLERKDLISLITKILNVDILHDIEKETTAELSLIKRLNKKTKEEYDNLAECEDELFTKLVNEKQVVAQNITKMETKLATLTSTSQDLNRRYNPTKMPSLEIIEQNILLYEKKLQGSNIKSIDEATLQKRKDLIIRSEILKSKIQESLTEYDVRDLIALDLKKIKELISVQESEFATLEIISKPKYSKVFDDEQIKFIKAKAHSRPESNIELQRKLKPTKIKQTDIPSDPQLLSTALKTIAEGLPNFDELEKERNAIEKRLQAFLGKFGNLKYELACDCCTNNKNLMQSIMNVEEEKRKIDEINKILSERKKREDDLRIAQERIEIENYWFNNNILLILNSRSELQQITLWDSYVEWDKKRRELNRLWFAELTLINEEIRILKQLSIEMNWYKQLTHFKELKTLQITNSALETKLEVINASLNETQQTLSALRTKYETLISKTGHIQSQMNRKKKLEEEQQNNIDKIEFLQYYFNCINHKTGIPSLMMNNVSKLLNDRCNDILQQITDFEVEFSYDKEFKIYTIDKGIKIPAVMGSGFQKFLLDMIMRITLTNVSVLSCPNIIFIDEGFGCLDTENFIEVAKILTKIKSNFDAMILITHLRELKAYTDISMTIETKNCLSKLTYGNITISEKQLEIGIGVEENKVLDKDLFFEKHDDGMKCKACGKIMKRTSGKSLESHLKSSTLKKKHNKFLTMA